jgi:hypothetical protein
MGALITTVHHGWRVAEQLWCCAVMWRSECSNQGHCVARTVRQVWQVEVMATSL